MQPNNPSALPDDIHRDALRDLPAAVVIMDAAQRIVFANSAFEALSGCSLRELLQDGHRFLPEQDASASLSEAFDTARPFRGEVEIRRDDGTSFRSLLTLAPLLSPLTAIAYSVGVVVDIADGVDRTVTLAQTVQERSGSGSDLQPLDVDLRAALGRGEIVAHFQPQYDSRAGHLTGYEALARWHHPTLGVLPPDRFIPLAEANGLISRLGTEMMEQTCRFADLVTADHPLQMQVNVSVEQLRVRGLADRIRGVLAGHQDRSWSLSVEVTESALIIDHGLASAELDRLRDLGVGVSIDDFGSGYSSLSQLRDLPATELKIDGSFVHREDAVGSSLITAIVALADSLGLLVVAEGIETRSQLARARALGCDRLQGMLLCPPLSPDDALGAPQDIADLLLAAD